MRLDPSAYEALQVGLPVCLMRGPRVCLATTITLVAPHRAGAAVELDGVSDRDAACALIGCTLVTERARLPSVQAGEFYACDLLGVDAVSPSGDALGVVVDILATGANDVWVIRGPAGELLVPAVAHAVLQVDAAARRIIVDPDAATREK